MTENKNPNYKRFIKVLHFYVGLTRNNKQNKDNRVNQILIKGHKEKIKLTKYLQR